MSQPSDFNPFAATSLESSDPGVVTDAEVTRKQYLSHEVSVKSIGLLYWLGGILLGLATVSYSVVAMSGPSRYDNASFLNLLYVLLLGGIAALQIAVARGLRKLRPWSRTAATLLSVVGLLGIPIVGLLRIPIGTLVSLYFLYLLQCRKGKFVFSPQYQEVIAATPHLKYRTSATAWTVLVAIVALLILAVLFSLVGTMR